MEDFLRWDPERRPTAQQSLKYPYFQIVKRISSTTHHITPLSQIPQQNQSITNRTNGYSSNENNVDVNGIHFQQRNDKHIAYLQDSHSHGFNNEKFSFSNNGDDRNSGQSKKELNLDLINGMIGKLALSQQQQQNNLLTGTAKSVTRNAEELSDR